LASSCKFRVFSGKRHADLISDNHQENTTIASTTIPTAAAAALVQAGR